MMPRDAERRRKALAILARANPDRRAVKRAHRLLRDADRAGRIARNRAMKAAFSSLTAGLQAFMANANVAFQDARAAMERFSSIRVPMMLPGDEIQTVAVKGASRMGKTAAIAAAKRDLEPYMVRPIKIVPMYRLFELDPIDLEDPRVAPLQEMIADRARRFRERMEADVLAGRVHFPPPQGRCRHGVWLYGDSCATCGREDRDETPSPDAKRDD